uniref:Putative secreted protein fat body overexpressed n=1 Tax=Rhipicephalus microplus TaxID=6941 RepID=A0A6M2DBK4_RHIMP
MQGLVFTYVSIVVPFVYFHVCFTCVRSCVYVVYHLSYPPPSILCVLPCVYPSNYKVNTEQPVPFRIPTSFL